MRVLSSGPRFSRISLISSKNRMAHSSSVRHCFKRQQFCLQRRRNGAETTLLSINSSSELLRTKSF
jgi:hypothetical protein